MLWALRVSAVDLAAQRRKSENLFARIITLRVDREGPYLLYYKNFSAARMGRTAGYVLIFDKNKESGNGDEQSAAGSCPAY